ncbi:hypothetical protein H2248_009674 [Termitomyces sp. 'cryptogamus']|nr:hypothetical protein H2248_009674 [Termitomyces sp. 'cryptogamus']
MVSRKLMGVWAALDLFLLAAGAVAVALSVAWRAENTLLNFVLTPNYLAGKSVLYYYQDYQSDATTCQLVWPLELRFLSRLQFLSARSFRRIMSPLALSSSTTCSL